MFTKLYLTTLPILFALDIFWVGFLARGFYKSQIGFIMRSNVEWVAVVLFYLLFAVGLVVFVITPAIESGSLVRVILYGALFGLITYATYDLTNLATLNNWPVLMVVVDLLWGSFLCATTSALVYSIYIKML